MASVQELLLQIKVRPELYLGQRSLSLLQAYLNGWLNRDEDSVTDSELIGEFQDWVQHKYDIKSSQSWAQIVLFYSSNEYDGLDNFFRLFEEFLGQKEGH